VLVVRVITVRLTEARNSHTDGGDFRLPEALEHMSLTQPNTGAGDPHLAVVARRAQLSWAPWVSEDGSADSCRPQGGAGQYQCGSAIASAQAPCCWLFLEQPRTETVTNDQHASGR
jgi:hypothetical protein